MAADQLAVAGIVALGTWIVFASLLYLTEKDSPAMDAGRAMGGVDGRFASIPRAMPYTLILLSGGARRGPCSHSALPFAGMHRDSPCKTERDEAE